MQTSTTLFPQQQCVLDKLPEIQQLLEKYQRSQQWLKRAESDANHFIVRVPLIGAFSSGKSTILNDLIGENLFSINIDPETAVPAELSYSSDEAFIACYEDGSRSDLTREQIRTNQLGNLHPKGRIEVHLPANELAQLPHLRLVDIPGRDSGNNQHDEAINNYLARSLAYCLVVNVDAGTLNESTRAALNELKLHDMPVIVIISKCDKKTAPEVNSVTQQVNAEVEKILGKPALAVVQVSARKHDLAQLITALSKLEHQTEVLFVQNVVKPIIMELQQFCQSLNILINKDDLNSEAIAVERETKAREMQAFNQRLKQDTQRLEDSLPKVLAIICRQVKDRLTEQLDSLTRQAEAGKDLSSSIENIVRVAATQGIKQEFDPKVQNYFQQIASELPQDLQLNLSLPTARQIETNDLGSSNDGLKKTVLATIGFILTKHPITIALSPLLMPLLDTLYNLIKSKADREIAASEHREQIRHSILNEIENIVIKVERSLESLLKNYVKEAQLSIVEAVQEQRDALDAALAALDEKLREGQAAYAEAQQQYQADLQTIQANLTLFENL
jgi:GTPase Era involved in 16S rRNA processing